MAGWSKSIVVGSVATDKRVGWRGVDGVVKAHEEEESRKRLLAKRNFMMLLLYADDG